MTARPSSYTPELADRILGELRAGRSVREICRDNGMPCRDTLFEWIRQDRDGFGGRYRQARQIGGAPGRVDYSREIADRVIEDLMGGRTISEVCGDPDMPGLTAINSWIATDRDNFAVRYRAAREVGPIRQAQVAYSAEIAERILAALETGQTLREICAEPDMPSAGAVHGWRRADRDNFAARYQAARKTGYEAIGDDLLQIVDDRRNDWIEWRDEDGVLRRMLDPQRNIRAELRARNRWRLLSKMLPEPFGDAKDAAARPGGGGASESDLAEMRALINGRSRGLPGEDEPLDED
jgi:transposase-like protein